MAIDKYDRFMDANKNMDRNTLANLIHMDAIHTRDRRQCACSVPPVGECKDLIDTWRRNNV